MVFFGFAGFSISMVRPTEALVTHSDVIPVQSYYEIEAEMTKLGPSIYDLWPAMGSGAPVEVSNEAARELTATS